ncbi:YiaA/YiaB family inner membrane protein [Virgisporangium ochraceum]|jgi:hypothetical protein|uniref:YiaAB two helix domain-containing protein n=1 Tax=Virgisporangium ochraceum TaxID=65505 RepID=A0A8J3ZXK1_9ACTN|nr:YiaA/YiaB family inner membrane protein [Virgisporangium ochraceum]GIJ70028.1 hypothetical protein Voc01_049450 [Virgisporangium ochraceum]
MTVTSQSKPSAAFYIQSVISFVVALTALIIGVISLQVDIWVRGFLSVGVLYLVTSTFTLAKVIRDQQEASTALSRIDQARLEKMLAEHDPYRAVG